MEFKLSMDSIQSEVAFLVEEKVSLDQYGSSDESLNPSKQSIDNKKVEVEESKKEVVKSPADEIEEIRDTFLDPCALEDMAAPETFFQIRMHKALIFALQMAGYGKCIY